MMFQIPLAAEQSSERYFIFFLLIQKKVVKKKKRKLCTIKTQKHIWKDQYIYVVCHITVTKSLAVKLYKSQTVI